jgi:hypothetical protein
LKLISKILLVLVFVISIALIAHVSAVAGGIMYWDRAASVEEGTMTEPATLYNQGRAKLAAVAEDERQRRSGIQIDAAVRASTHSILTEYSKEAATATAEIKARRESLEGAMANAQKTPGMFAAVESQLSGAVATRAADKDKADEADQKLLLEVAKARKEHARANQQYLELEYNLSMQSGELARLQERIATYRWLRPDLQEELGDNGTHVTGEVSAALGQSLTINKGSKDGVELYQKFSILRGDAIVAVANVVSVGNGSAELEIRELPLKGRGVEPRVGDIAVPRQLMLTMDRAALGALNK